MAQKNIRGIRAAWLDATDAAGRAAVPKDPPPTEERRGVRPGQWEGAPADNLPPDCPIVPLGIDGKVSYFVDSMGQVIPVSAAEWSKKMLSQLFALRPNYLYWAWPRWGAPKAGKPSAINGLEVDDAHQCLLKAAARRGLFTMLDRVRGRGAWRTRDGALVWHAGDAIYTVHKGALVMTPPGEIDGIFYPHRPSVTRPWMSPVDPSDSPAQKLLADLGTWTWERPELDPVLVLGWLGCAFLGAALDWRPHLFVTGDKGVGKSTLNFVVKALLGDSLHASADTTAAGIYQRVKQDCLPVAIDELEASADNRKVMAVVGLARLAASGALMYRGGAEHEGVEFRLSNTFMFASINPPPLEPQDRSRMAILNMGALDAGRLRREPSIDAESDGRMILRALMDAWPHFPRTLSYWRDALRSGGIDARGQDTFGTLLAVANLLLGDEAMEAAGLPVTDERRLGDVVARATGQDRAETGVNWQLCLDHLLGSQIEAWRGGAKPIIGQVLDEWRCSKIVGTEETNSKLGLVGLKARDVVDASTGLTSWLLYVPLSSVMLARLYAGSKWQAGVWTSALKQGPKDVVIRDRGNDQNTRINGQTTRCLIVDLAAYDAVVSGKD